jgi:hypothetical protein
MSAQAPFQHGKRVIAPAHRVQPDGIDVAVARLAGIERRGLTSSSSAASLRF